MLTLLTATASGFTLTDVGSARRLGRMSLIHVVAAIPKSEKEMAKSARKPYTVTPFPRARRFALDAGRLGHGKHIVHGLLEMDVTDSRRHIRDHKARTGETLSFTAYVITCLGKAVAAHREVQAQRNWRNQIIVFDDVDVSTMIEVETDGRRVPMPHIIRAADKRSHREIHTEIRAAQSAPTKAEGATFMRCFLLLPWFIRRVCYWVVMRAPLLFPSYSFSVLVTAVGMFGKGGGWGIPTPSFSLTVTLGGIVEKPGVIDGRIEIREYLCVTLSFDHNIIDGAPAARFTQRFRELVEMGYGLVE